MEEMAAYKDEFLSEAKDYITKINSLLLELEKDSENLDFVNEIFRFCHTLKGNSAAMGYSKYSQLSHSMEDILSKARSKEVPVTPEVLEVLFRAADQLDKGLELIREERGDELKIDFIDDQLKALSRTGGKRKKYELSEKYPFEEDELDKVREAQRQGKDCFRIIVVFKRGAHFKRAKAFILKRDLGTFGGIISSNPPFNEMSETNFHSFEFIMTSDKKGREVDIRVRLSKLTELDKYFIMSYDATIKSEEIKAEEPRLFERSARSIRINIQKLDNLMNLVGELLTGNIRLKQLAEKAGEKEISELVYKNELVLKEVQEEVMAERMVPLDQMFSKFPRLVRDLAKISGKKINLVMEGEDIEIDRAVMEELGDPMIHLLRNAVDHGVELPEVREKAGKNKEGMIRIIAKRGRDTATIEVIDDGSGIDPEAVKSAAVRKGLITREVADRISTHEAQHLIFKQGMSTSKKITSVSGRGVGMDVIQAKVGSCGGFLKMVSKIGEGTSITLHVPLTLALIKALLVWVKDQVFAVPLTNIAYTVPVSKKDIKTIQGQEVLIQKGMDVPIVRLHDKFGIKRVERDSYIAIVGEKEERPIALLADSIFNEQEILLKSLGKLLKDVKGISGATILPEGRICLIVDINSLID